MHKFTVPLVSFVAGIVVAAIYFNFQNASTAGLDEESYKSVESLSVSNTIGDSAPGSASNAEASSRQPDRVESHRSDDMQADSSPVGGETLSAATVQAASARPNLGGDDHPAQRFAPDQTNVTEEIAPFFAKDSDASSFHDELERQDRDESWAAYMEAQITAYLASKPSLSTFQVAQIQCRSSMCEIHAVGYGPDAATIWFSSIADMPHQPWAAEFGDELGTFQMDEFNPGVTSILIQMARNKSGS